MSTPLTLHRGTPRSVRAKLRAALLCYCGASYERQKHITDVCLGKVLFVGHFKRLLEILHQLSSSQHKAEQELLPPYLPVRPRNLLQVSENVIAVDFLEHASFP